MLTGPSSSFFARMDFMFDIFFPTVCNFDKWPSGKQDNKQYECIM